MERSWDILGPAVTVYVRFSERRRPKVARAIRRMAAEGDGWTVKVRQISWLGNIYADVEFEGRYSSDLVGVVRWDDGAAWLYLGQLLQHTGLVETLMRDLEQTVPATAAYTSPFVKREPAEGEEELPLRTKAAEPQREKEGGASLDFGRSIW